MSEIRLKKLDIAGAAGFLAYSSSAVITPICLLELASDLDFSLAGGGGIEAVRTFLILVILLAGGFAAARWGKSKVMALGSLVLAGGMLAYSFAPVYGVVLAAMVFVGVGGGILEGLINPLVQEMHPKDSGRYLNIVNAFWSIGVMSSMLLVGDLLTRGVSWRIIVAAFSAPGIVAGVLFLIFSGEDRSAGSTAASGSQSETIPSLDSWDHVKDILRRGRFWVFGAAMFFAAGAEAAFTFWSASYIQLHFNALARAGGFGTACFAGGMIAGRLLSGRFVRQEGLRTLILITAFSGAIVSTLVFMIGSLPGFFVLLFMAGLSVACFWPSIQSYAADCMTVDSTMLFILLSCGGIPGFGFASWLMGILGDAYGLQVSFAVIPVFFVVLGVIIFFERKNGR
jgi:fucose permease